MSSETTSLPAAGGAGILRVANAAASGDAGIQAHGWDARARTGVNRKVLLVDNGSLEPASTQQLRQLAAELEARVGCEVVPASIAHSSKIPAEQLDDRPAELFDAALDRVLREGASEVCVLPLFVGPSYAIVRHVPAVIAERQKAFPRVAIGLAAPLFVPGESRLGQLLAGHVCDLLAAGAATPPATNVVRSDHVRGRSEVTGALAKSPVTGIEDSVSSSEMAGASAFTAPGRREPSGSAAAGSATSLVRSDQRSGRAKAGDTKLRTGVRVAVVDHGSPSRGVTEVRDAVAAQVCALLGEEVAAVAACSMERRDGPEFAFNEPLLENLLRDDGWRDGPVIVALLFIAPGRHAGAEGDVAQIVKRTRPDGGAGVRFTPVMGAHPLLLDVLADRVRDVRHFGAEPAAVGAIGTM